MTNDELRRIVADALNRIAPEVEPSSIRSDVGLRDQLDIDSMDFLNFVLALHERLDIDIPEAEYPRLATLDSAVAYLSAKLSR